VARPPFLVRFLQYFFNKHGRWKKSKQQKGEKTIKTEKQVNLLF